MHKYLYCGVHVSGTTVSGEVSARSRSEAFNLLRKKNLRALAVWSRAGTVTQWLLSTVQPRNLSLFTAQFASMVATGLSAADALDIMANRPEHWRISEQLRTANTMLKSGGRTLAQALAQQGRLFSPFYCRMIQEGESRGCLKSALNALTRYDERAYSTYRCLRTMLTYPLLFVSMAMIGLAFLLAVVVPKFSLMFATMGAELPVATRAVTAAGMFVGRNLLPIVAALLALIVAAKLASTTERGQRLLDWLALNLTVIGDLERKAIVGQIAHMLAALCEMGVDPAEALVVSTKSLSNREIQRRCRKNITGNGHVDLSQALAMTGIMPSMLIQIIMDSRKAGNLVATMSRISRFYEEEVEAAAEAFNSVVEPALILALGLLVTGILIAMYAPMLAISAG